MSFVMTYVAAVPSDKKDDYIDQAKYMAEIFKEYGATRVVECWGKDVPPGKKTSFPMAVQAGDGDEVVFGWQEWPNQEEQQKGFQAAMSDPRIREKGLPPLNGETMIFAGFDVMADV